MLPYSGGESSVLFRRSTAGVLTNVVSGYASMEAAARDYGVAVRYLGTPERLVRLLEHYTVDEEVTARLRRGRDQSVVPTPTAP
jgi:N-methylhydantoinase B